MRRNRKINWLLFKKKPCLWGIVLVLLLWGCAPVQAAETQMRPAESTPTPVPTPVTLRVCLGQEGSTVDPSYVWEREAGEYLGHLFEGLMKYAPIEEVEPVSDMEVVPGLAESAVCSEDGLVYRFTLRKDARWSDGMPITAGDFVYAWQRLLQVGQSPGAGLLDGVLSRVYEESDRVLVAVLKAPCSWFLKLCAAYYMAPLRQDMIERYAGDWTAPEHIVVSGGYTISHWVHDDAMTLVPNPWYYDRSRLGPEKMIWQFGDGQDCHVSHEGDTYALPDGGTYFLYINANAVRDWRVRAAMLLAVDRGQLAQLTGHCAAEGFVPQGISLTAGRGYYPREPPMYVWLQQEYPAYDLQTDSGRTDLARLLMESARSAGTWYSGNKLYYSVPPGALHQTVAKACAARWQEVLGMQVEVVEKEREGYKRTLTGRTFHVACLQWVADYDDPQSFLQVMERGGRDNHSGWGDVRYNRLLEAAAEADGATRDALLQEAEEFLFRAEGFAVCPLLWTQTHCAITGVTGAGYSAAAGYGFHYASVR